MIEGKTIVIAAVRFFDPSLRELLGDRLVFPRCRCITAHGAKFGIRSKRANCLRGEIDVVSQMTGEVIRAKLIFRIKSFVFQISRPLGELRPVEPSEIRMAFHLCHRGKQDEHVARFLNGHLIFLRALATAIHLAVGMRIGAEVMRGKGEFPPLRGRVIHERNDERFGKCRPEQKELRRHGIKHI